ncbi:hypothetical protein Aduo_015169 [Ancylostoma duodenale]
MDTNHRVVDLVFGNLSTFANTRQRARRKIRHPRLHRCVTVRILRLFLLAGKDQWSSETSNAIFFKITSGSEETSDDHTKTGALGSTHRRQPAPLSETPLEHPNRPIFPAVGQQSRALMESQSDKDLPIFIRNRVRTIREKAQDAIFRHIPGSLNPADVASRGCTINELISNNLWWNGPSFLLEEEDTWPNERIDSDAEGHFASTVCCTTHQEPEIEPMTPVMESERFSK